MTTHSLGRIDVEEQTRNADGLLLEQLFEECEAVVQGGWEGRKVKPNVERCAGRHLDGKTHGLEAREHVVALLAEVRLQRDLVLLHTCRVQERQRHDLHRVRGAAVEEAARLTDGRDQVLGAEDPAHTPARETEALCQSIDDHHRVLVHVVHVLCARDGLSQQRRVIVVTVPAVELVKDDAAESASELSPATHVVLPSPMRTSSLRSSPWMT